jgi:hypothetical protein
MGCALSVAVSLALGAISSSDLGVVLVGSGNGATELVAACPRAVKTALSPTLSGASAGALLRSHEQQCPGADGIVELPDTTIFPLINSGVTDANTYWGAQKSLVFASAGSPALVDPADVDWVAAPKNLFTIANPDVSPAMAAYASEFVAELARLVRAESTLRGARFDLLLPPWLAGPSDAFCGVVTAARAVDPNVGWTYRATSAALSSSVDAELGTTFGYRAIRAACSSLGGAPLFVELSAAGGWTGNGTRQPSAIVDWLRFVDQTVDADADVHLRGAVLLRSLGAATLDDLAPVVPQLAAYLASPATPGDGGTPGGSTGGTGPFQPPAGGSGGAIGPGGHRGGCGNPGGGLAAFGLLPLLWLRRRRAAPPA